MSHTGWCPEHEPEALPKRAWGSSESPGALPKRAGQREETPGVRRGSRSGSRNPLYGSQAWKDLSEAFKRHNPLCQDCQEAGAVVPVEIVDHIEEVRDRPELSLVWSNLRSLCRPCHAAKTAAAARKRRASLGDH